MTMLVSSCVVIFTTCVCQAIAQCPNPPNNSSEDCLYPSNCNSNIIANGSSGAGVIYSPFYEQILSPGGDHEASDGVCCTFFPFGDINQLIYILMRCITYKNGTVNVQRHVYASIQSTPGAYRAAGLAGPDGCDTCVFNDYALAQPCPGVFLFTRCYIYGDCKRAYSGRDDIVAFSSSQTISPECYDATVKLGIEKLGDPEPVRLPYSLTPKCVTQIGAVQAINADRVPCEQRYALP